MFHTVNLIAAVQKKPCLWKTNDIAYTNKVAKKIAWTEVAKEVFPGFEHLRAEEMAEKIREIQIRWRSVRDCYIKEFKLLQRQNSGDDTTKKRKKYVFFDNLSFLNPSMKPRKKRSQVDQPLKEELHRSIEVYEKNRNIDMATPSLQERNENKKQLGDNSSEILKTNEELKEDEDADKLFLLSVLPEIKHMSRPQKMQFRFGVLRLINNINYNYASSPITQYPSRSFQYL